MGKDFIRSYLKNIFKSQNPSFPFMLRYITCSDNFQYEFRYMPRLNEKSSVFQSKTIFEIASKYLLPFFFYFLPLTVFSQNDSLYIEGKIFDSKSNLPLPYAHVYNAKNYSGTISNFEGYFRLKIGSLSDSVICSFIGYQTQMIKIEKANSFITIKLNEKVNELGEVIVIAGDDTYLFEMIQKAKKNVNYEVKTGKAYFDLKSFYNTTQIEQVEGFYNADVINYDPVKLSMKTGRIALKEYGNRIFTSLETSRVFTMQKLFEHSKHFPQSPVELSVKKSRKIFSAQLEGKYMDENNDSVFVISFYPKSDSSNKFITTVWLKPESNFIIKVKYLIKNASVYPFYPLFREDSIKSVDMEIVKTFTSVSEKPIINHIDFNYSVKYKSRGELTYDVSTRAVLHIFDFNNSFNLPYFSFANEDIGDYRKINAIPHNEYFWNNYSDFKMYDQYNRNNEFYNHPMAVTNKKIFNANKYGPFGLLQQPYVQWTGKRILFKEADTVKEPASIDKRKISVKSQFYDLSVKIFFDYFDYADTMQIISKTIFDPYESYFQLEMDRSAQCFINIYFDLVEIERRKLLVHINQSDMKPSTLKRLYEESQESLYEMKLKYFRETERGKEFKKMEKWNDLVKDELKIDNIQMFFPNGK